MDISDIIQAIQANRINITQYARKEAKDDSLLLDNILFSTHHGEIIEDYPTDTPYPSCLILGQCEDGRVVHRVWAFAADRQIAILITVYCPDPNRWINWRIRK